LGEGKYEDEVDMIILQLKRIYSRVQAISLDVVLGSGILNLAIAKYYQVNLPISVLAALLIAVWIIYCR
jgi:multisubunit Na+/H+ antiporter MnhG subunit